MTAHGPFSPRDWDAHPPYVYPGYKSTGLRGPTQPLIPLKQTLSELTGPVYSQESVGPLDHDLTRNARVNGEPLGERIVVAGRVLDEDGRPLPDTLIEVWQANAAGRYIHKSDQRGNHPNAWRPNHIHFSLFGPSFITRLVTQMYFPGDPLLDLDPIYLGAGEDARELLISKFDLDITEPEFALGYRFDIVLRGRNATPAQE
jgi:protocatechuate 3,4-dioxygenase beta subunit